MARWAKVVAVLLALAPEALAQSSSQRGDSPSVEEVLGLVDQYCGGCHVVPPPSILPKESWPRVIDAMAELAKNRTGGDYIPQEAARHIKALYYGNSPEALPVLPYIDQPHAERRFAQVDIGDHSAIPQILNIQATSLKDHDRPQFLVSDGERGQLLLLEAPEEVGGRWRESALGDMAIPITARVVDYNGNGRSDILVADLGEFPPSGVLAGKVYLLEQNEDGTFGQHLLMEGLGRVSDLQVLDLDGDGDLDLAVSVFGGGQVGEVFWLENRGEESDQKHRLLALSGALAIKPTDLNGDGRMDLVTLVAQEHEAVIAFINRGDGEFERRELASAPHPMFGSTSLTVEDLDQDGDPDIVFTNGDVFDTQKDPKPYHGVQWLENKGSLEFQAHDIGRFYGAASAAVGDMDGDGDLDVVVGSWANYWDDERRQALVWFENNGDERFQPRPVTGAHRGLVPIELVDVTGNGQLDILTGAFRVDILESYVEVRPEGNTLDSEAMKAKKRPPTPRLLLFENRSVVP